MKKCAFFLGLIVAAAGLTGCAQMLTPYGYGPGYRPYPLARPPVLPVDQSAAARGRWDQVMRLPAASTIDVLTVDGATHIGQLTGSDSYSVRLLVGGIEQQVTRAEVLRVDLVDLPGSEVGAVAKRAATGAALGLGAAALIAGVIGGPSWPPPGAMLRGGAAIGGVAGGEAALAARQGRLIYLAENQQPMLRRSGPIGSDTEPTQILESYSSDAWPAIQRVAVGAMLQVVRTNGWRHRGTLLAVDETSIRLDIDGAELRITRASIVRVEVVQIREPIPKRRDLTRVVPRPNLSLAGAAVGSFGPQGFVVAPGAAPLIRMGLPMLPFGGAQPQILQFQFASNHLMPSTGGGAPPGAGGAGRAARVMRAVVCHGHGVALR